MRRSFAVRAALVVLFVFVAAPAVLALNLPPTAEPQTVFTRGLDPLEITLTGSDPEQRDLTFRIVEPPRYGELSEVKPIVPEPVIDPRTGELVQPPITSALVVYRPFEGVPDSFTFMVIDVEQATGVAVVTINPPQNEPPPPPVETVIVDDVTAQVFRDTQSVLTLSGLAPRDVSLTFALLTAPRAGQIGELRQGSETPRRTASLPYMPERGFLGDDVFQFEACGDINGQKVCDSGVFTIRVIERPAEPLRLASDITVKTTETTPKTFSLAADHRAWLPDKTLVLRANPAGGVADENRDGLGDNANDLPGSRPLFMSAGVEQKGEPGAIGTARMQMEWDLSAIDRSLAIVGATVVLNTHRATEEGLPTYFFAAGASADGALRPSDFEAAAEAIPGAVMPLPSLKEMPVDAEGTFSFDVLGELKAALQNEVKFFAVQGRVDETLPGPAAGLEVRTSAFDNVDRQLEPELRIDTAIAPRPLAYTVTSLPEVGTLADRNRNVIRQTPYPLPDAYVVYTPPAGYRGQTSFTFQVSDGFFTDSAMAHIWVLLGRCAENEIYCYNGR